MTQEYPILYIEGDVDGDGSQETGEFHMQGNVDVEAGIRTGYVLSDAGGQINAAIGNLIGDGQSKQEGFYLSFGGGTRRWQITFQGWDGSDLRWGDSGNGGTASDATGETVLRQLSVFIQYLAVADLDSRGTATLEYADWSQSGTYEPADVVVEEPSLSNPSDQPSTIEGTLTCLAAAGEGPLDAQEQDEF